MSARTHEALSRTSRLINEQFFGGHADEECISAAMPQLTVRIAADATNARTAAAQTAIVTLASLVARMGMSVELRIPDLEVCVPQPPLTGQTLGTALTELGTDLVPGAVIGTTPDRAPIITFAIGDTPCGVAGAMRLSGSDWELEVRAASLPGHPWDASLPFGALACAGTAASEALRAVLPHLARLTGAQLAADAHRLEVGKRIRLDLRDWFSVPIATEIGSVDVVSGGAITSAAIYVLLRVPDLAGSLRVIEGEALDLSNVNRYMLSRASLGGVAKSMTLAAHSTASLRITGLGVRYEPATAKGVHPLARRVLVGVDHIPSRWLVQRHAPGWVGVGATQSLDALVSAHVPGEPCAGCLHGREPDTDELVPTVSFVSFWAGLLLALELLTEAGGSQSDRPALMCWPFGFDRPHLMRLPVAAQPTCPVGCASSRTRAA